MERPCGHCYVGVYDPVPLKNGDRLFAGIKSLREGVSRAPRCRRNPALRCGGAMDWLRAWQYENRPTPHTEGQQ